MMVTTMTSSNSSRCSPFSILASKFVDFAAQKKPGGFGPLLCGARNSRHFEAWWNAGEMVSGCGSKCYVFVCDCGRITRKVPGWFRMMWENWTNNIGSLILRCFDGNTCGISMFPAISGLMGWFQENFADVPFQQVYLSLRNKILLVFQPTFRTWKGGMMLCLLQAFSFQLGIYYWMGHIGFSATLWMVI